MTQKWPGQRNRWATKYTYYLVPIAIFVGLLYVVGGITTERQKSGVDFSKLFLSWAQDISSVYQSDPNSWPDNVALDPQHQSLMDSLSKDGQFVFGVHFDDSSENVAICMFEFTDGPMYVFMADGSLEYVVDHDVKASWYNRLKRK